MTSRPEPGKDFKSKLNEPQVWVFLFLFFAFLPLSIYYYAFKLYLEDTFNRNRTSMVQAFQRELAFRAIGVDVEAQPCGGVVDAIEMGDEILAEALVR